MCVVDSFLLYENAIDLIYVYVVRYGFVLYQYAIHSIDVLSLSFACSHAPPRAPTYIYEYALHDIDLGSFIDTHCILLMYIQVSVYSPAAHARLQQC